MRFKFLDGDEEDLIHSESLRCLAEMGILIRSPSVLKILDDSGADADEKTGIVKIPESMVVEALKKAPKRFDLCSRDRKHDMAIPVESVPYVSTTGLAVHIIDPRTGERRRGTRKDLSDFAKLTDALNGADFFWTTIVPVDVSESVHTVHELWVSLQNTGKHVQQVEVMDSTDATLLIELASLIVGGRDELRKRPIFSVVCSPVSPLTFSKGMVEAQVALAKAGVPVISMTMPLAGISSPVTVAGTITVVNSENLASLVISQFAAEHSPFVYSSDSVPGDMATGSVNFGAPEVPFIMNGLGQMARRYGLPCMVGDWGFEGENPGVFNSFSEMSSTSLDTFSGTDLCSGLGSMDEAKSASLEQVVIDSFLWENFRSFLRKVEVNERTVALDVIKEVGHGNSYLMHPHTLKNYRTELVIRDKDKLAWELYSPKERLSEAEVTVKKILDSHELPQVDRDIILEGDRLIKEFERSVLS